MPKETIITGLDVGTSNIRVVVGKIKEDNPKPNIIGAVCVPNFGMRKGIVVSVDEVSKRIRKAIKEASEFSGYSIKKVYLSVGGAHISCCHSKGVVAVSRADGEISQEDVKRAIQAASAVSIPSNRETLHIIPLNFAVDKEIVKDPIGMTGIRLEVDTLIIYGFTPYVKNLIKAVTSSGLEISQMAVAPLASAYSVLNDHQKELGVLLLDIGGGTSGISVFEEEEMIYSHVLPVGSSHITNDIAIGLRSDIDTAEKVKTEYGWATSYEVNKKDVLDLSKISKEKGKVSLFEVSQIIEARLSEILELTNKVLKKVDRAGLLPAGVVLTGGGAKIRGLVDLAKRELKLPVQLGFPLPLNGLIDKVDDPGFATALGLIFLAKENLKTKRKEKIISSLIKLPFGKIKRILKGFLP